MKKDLHNKRPPLIIEPDSKHPKYLYPHVADGPEILIDAGESISVFCPGRTDVHSSSIIESSWLEVKGKKVKSSNISIPIECIGNNRFEAEGITVNKFSQIACEQKPRAFYNPILRACGTKCGNGDRYEIGFVFDDGSFLRTIELCHDTKTANTLWAHSVIESVNHVEVRYTGKKNKGFKTGILYKNMTLTMINPYNLNHTYNHMITTFNSPDMADQYASPKMGMSLLQIAINK